MRSPDWLTGLLAFLGAAVGAASSYFAAQRGTTQREQQSQREEWGRRFSMALDDIAADDLRRRTLGRELLVELAKSDLATAEERATADRLLEVGARLDAQGTDVATAAEGVALDDLAFQVDDGDRTPPDGEKPWARRS